MYGTAIGEPKQEGKLRDTVKHRQKKYLNNVIETDHTELKQLSRPVWSIKSQKTASTTVMGFDALKNRPPAARRLFRGELKAINV